MAADSASFVESSFKRTVAEDEEKDGPLPLKRSKNPISFSKCFENHTWLQNHYRLTVDKNDNITSEELVEEYMKTHPNSKTANVNSIGKLVREVFGSNKTRSLLVDKVTQKRFRAFRCMVKKETSGEHLQASISKSLLCLPQNDLLILGWSFERFTDPVGLRYRKVFKDFYIDKQPVVVEVSFSNIEGSGHHEERLLNDVKLDATLLCHGRVTNARDWDNENPPTLLMLKILFNTLTINAFCFGFDVPKNWEEESLLKAGQNARVLTMHKTIDEILSGSGQTKLAANDCEILKSATDPACAKCCGLVKQFCSSERTASCSSDTVGGQEQESAKIDIIALRQQVYRLRKRNKQWKKKLEELDRTEFGNCDSSSTDKT